MTRQKWILLIGVVALVGATAAVLLRLHTHQRLGLPGVKYAPIAGGVKVAIQLPENVPGWVSQPLPEDSTTTNALPKDTSFAQRSYKAPGDVYPTQVNVVLMGTDRSSIHKPQFCLEGQGWQIDDNASRQETIHIQRPQPYDLHVMKLVSTLSHDMQWPDGEICRPRRVFVYWYVADDALSADPTGLDRMARMAWHLLQTGVLQRWAYVIYTVPCKPGEEEATFEQMKKLIAASVPEFQLTPRSTADLTTKGRHDPTEVAGQN